MGFISDIEKASILNNGINFFNQRQYGLAKIQFDRYLNTYGYDKWVVEIKANCHMLLQEYREAISCYDKILRHGPDQYALNNKGHAYNELKQPSNALNALNKCTQNFPNYADGWSNKGRSLAALGRYSESFECYQRALQIDPYHIDAKIGFQILNEKLIEMNAGINNEVSNNFETPRKKFKDTYYGRRGITFIKDVKIPEYTQQDYEEDIDKYEKLLKDDPKNTDNLFFIYYDLMKLERYEEALEYCDKLLEINPYNKDYKNYKINCLKKLGKTEEEAKMETSRQLAEQNEKNTYKTDWVECPKCGRKISSMAIEIHKKCPHCSHQFKKLKNQSLRDAPEVSEKQSELDISHENGKGIKSKVKRFFG